MFGRNLKLFSLFGFEVRVNVTWTFLAILIAWSLAQGVFPQLYEGLPTTTYWWMAIGAVIGVFFSIVLHELSHSLVARAYGMRIRGITLFMFGGMAEAEAEPPTPKAEFLMAIAGPAISLALSGLLLFLAEAWRASQWPEPMVALASYLGFLNFLLAAFNLIPAFPMDGGRALRAGLWALKSDKRWATQWASRMGALFGLVLMTFGLVFILNGIFVAGLWWILIGMFIRGAAQGSFLQMELERLMGGLTVSEIMESSFDAITPDATVGDLVTEHIYKVHQDVFPVCQDNRLVGTVSPAQVKQIPHTDWGNTRVRDIMAPADAETIIDPDEDVLSALRRFQISPVKGLVVARDGRPFGVLTQSDLMRFVSLKLSFEQA